MSYYLDDKYIDEVLKEIDKIDSDFYYVQMGQAWLIATAFAKQRETTLEYLKKHRINKTTYGMAIRKIRESNRISKEDKNMVIKL